MRHSRHFTGFIAIASVLLGVLALPSTTLGSAAYRVGLCQAQGFIDSDTPVPNTHIAGIGRPGAEFEVYRLTPSSAPGMTVENVSEGCARPQIHDSYWFGAEIHNHPLGWPHDHYEGARRDMVGSEGAGIKLTLPEGLRVSRASWQAWGVDRLWPGQLILKAGFIVDGDLVIQSRSFPPPSGHFEPTTIYPDVDYELATGFVLFAECQESIWETCEGTRGSLAVVRNFGFTLIDKQPPRIEIQPSDFTQGHWSSGAQTVHVEVNEKGSGIRSLTATVAGRTVTERSYQCEIKSAPWPGGDQIAGALSPCPTGVFKELIEVDTRGYPDGIHRLEVCVLEYAASDPTTQLGAPVCQSRTVRIDNVAPKPPTQAQVAAVTASLQSEPQDVSWPDPGRGDAGSAIRTATYEFRDLTGRSLIGPVSIATSGNMHANAADPAANNIGNISQLTTPQQAGEFELLLSLTDLAGHESPAVVRRLTYVCDDSGQDPSWRPGLELGLAPSGSRTGRLKRNLRLKQGQVARLVGRITKPGAAAAPPTRLCLASRTKSRAVMHGTAVVESDSQGRFNRRLSPGPSREIRMVHRRGHREIISHPVQIDVTPTPSLQPGRRVIRGGQKLVFRGHIPGPAAQGRGVILQAKAGKRWLVFQRATTKKNGRYRFTYRPNAQGLTRPTRFRVRSVVPNQPGYPYAAGVSRVVPILIKPPRKRSTNRPDLSQLAP